MKKCFFMTLLGCNVIGLVASVAEKDEARNDVCIHESMRLGKKSESVINEAKKRHTKTRSQEPILGQVSCVQRGTEYFRKAFTRGDLVPDDCLFQTILAQIRSEGFEAPFLSWLAYQSLSEVAKDFATVNRRGRSRSDIRKSVTKRSIALPDEETWQRWCATHRFDIPGKQFTSVQVMQAAAQLVLAISADSAQSKHLYVCPAGSS